MSRIYAILLASLVGFALMTAAAMIQSHSATGTVPDLVCNVIFFPGKVLALPFHDRGDTGSSFFLHVRIATTIFYAGAAYLMLRPKRV
ncbi:MAG: hypothetical protein WCA21_08985 [Terracidiphilus sp.]|jgi:hypothetical protein